MTYDIFMVDEQKVGENEKTIFYVNDFCRYFGGGFSVIIGENKKSGEREYILLEGDEMRYAHPSIEAIYYRYICEKSGME